MTQQELENTLIRIWNDREDKISEAKRISKELTEKALEDYNKARQGQVALR